MVTFTSLVIIIALIVNAVSKTVNVNTGTLQDVAKVAELAAL